MRVFWQRSVSFFLLCLFVWGPGPLAAENPAIPAPVADTVYPVRITRKDLTIGSKGAPVTIVAYTSLTCLHCAQFHLNVIPQLYQSYINPGLVRIVLRHFPLDEIALYGAVLVEGAPRQERLARLDHLFENQEKWVFDKNLSQALGALCNMAPQDCKAYMENEDHQSPILKQWLDAQSTFHITATPSFVINGRVYEGEFKESEWRALLDDLLADAAGSDFSDDIHDDLSLFAFE